MSIDKSQIEWQRCFTIPKPKLNVFLVKIGMLDSNLGFFRMEYIFENGDQYDVVVNEYGHAYPFQENELTDFAKQLRGDL